MSFLDPFSESVPSAAETEAEVLRGWRLPGSLGRSGIRIAVAVGDLAVAPADVLCVSTNPRLTLLGGTGAAVVEAGGWSIRREADEIREERAREIGEEDLPEGSVHRTGAGRLPYRAILHCVASGQAHRTSEETIRRCVLGALERAAAEDASSLAMPIFAAGHVGFAFDRALGAVVDALRQAETPIEEVVLVVDRPERGTEIADRLDRELGRPE